MSFENAKKGIGRIFTAEILQLLAAIFTVIGLVMTTTGMAAIVGGGLAESDVAMVGGAIGGVVGIIMTVVGAIFALIGFILYIVGVGAAAKDEENFKRALICLILGLITTLVGAFTGGIPVLSGIMKVLTTVFTLISAISVINGIIVLAGKVNNAAIEKKGQTTMKLVAVILVLSIVASVIALITAGVLGSASDLTVKMLAGAGTSIIISGVMEIIAVILNIVQYFVFLSLLAGARKMFD